MLDVHEIDYAVECIFDAVARIVLDPDYRFGILVILLERAIERLLGPNAGVSREKLKLPPAPRLRDVYAALIDGDEFRAACGRISASYAW